MSRDYDEEGRYVGWMPRDANGDPYCPGCREAPENCRCCAYCGEDPCCCDEIDEPLTPAPDAE